jgi:hypothetical protein
VTRASNHVLLTGSAGFIGSHVSEALRGLQRSVITRGPRQTKLTDGCGRWWDNPVKSLWIPLKTVAEGDKKLLTDLIRYLIWQPGSLGFRRKPISRSQYSETIPWDATVPSSMIS